MSASPLLSTCLALYQHRQRYNDQCWKPKTSVTSHEVHTIRQHRCSHQKRAQLVFPAPVSRVIRVPSLLAPVFRGSAVFLLGIGLDNVAAGNFKCRQFNLTKKYMFLLPIAHYTDFRDVLKQFPKSLEDVTMTSDN